MSELIVWNWTISVLVHSGDVDSGHYTAFIKPGKESAWLKFDDDRVTKVTQKELFNDNFGGGMNGIKRYSSAYMLVYYRKSDLDTILCKVENAPEHIRNII